MSFGAAVGLGFNILAFSVFWTILGLAVDKLGIVFNYSIRLIPSYQDALNGFTMMQTVYGIVLPGIVFLALIFNYFIQENSMASGEV